MWPRQAGCDPMGLSAFGGQTKIRLFGKNALFSIFCPLALRQSEYLGVTSTGSGGKPQPLVPPSQEPVRGTFIVCSTTGRAGGCVKLPGRVARKYRHALIRSPCLLGWFGVFPWYNGIYVKLRIAKMAGTMDK